MEINIKDYKHIYMVGIGGISMSGIAVILKKWDYTVSGSDGVKSNQTDWLEENGIKVNIGQVKENITEGVVIKPVYPEYFGNGQRVIIKNKNDKFKERTVKAPKEKVEEIPMNDLELKYFNILREYMNESRLYSVISKIGEINQKKFGMIMGLFVKDLLNDFDKEYQDEIKKIEKETEVDDFNFKKILKAIQKEVADYIRPTLLKILDEQRDF